MHDLPAHRGNYDIYNLLENNKQLFKELIDPRDLNVLLRDLKTLSESHPTSYNTAIYERETEQVQNRLMFFLDRLA